MLEFHLFQFNIRYMGSLWYMWAHFADIMSLVSYLLSFYLLFAYKLLILTFICHKFIYLTILTG